MAVAELQPNEQISKADNLSSASCIIVSFSFGFLSCYTALQQYLHYAVHFYPFESQWSSRALQSTKCEAKHRQNQLSA